nr:hypothetical protein Iba_chr09eCG11540 [Ipomoea batatas]
MDAVVSVGHRDASVLLSESCKLGVLDDCLTPTRFSAISESPKPIGIGFIKLASPSAAETARLADLGRKAKPFPAIVENPPPLLLSSFSSLSDFPWRIGGWLNRGADMVNGPSSGSCNPAFR